MKIFSYFRIFTNFVLPVYYLFACTFSISSVRSVCTNITPFDNVFCYVHFSGNLTGTNIHAFVHSKYRIRDYHQKNTENLFNSFAQMWTWKEKKISKQKKKNIKSEKREFYTEIFRIYFVFYWISLEWLKKSLKIFASKQLSFFFFCFFI